MNECSDSSKLLTIPNCVSAVFVARPNRFLLTARSASGEILRVHVADPGRLEELLYSGNDLLVIPAPVGTVRKTQWSLVGARDSTGWILVNTSFHRKIATSLLTGSCSPLGFSTRLKAEVKSPSGDSRFDFLLNDDTWVEIKGCTLKKNNKALFPDAPTPRGLKHLTELTELAMAKKKTAVIFLVFVRKVDFFTPNKDTDPHFTTALAKAVNAGVKVYPVQLSFDGHTVKYIKILDLVTACNP